MKEQKGFTLIELMVVMAIIAILATAGLSAYGGYLKKARDATRLEDIRALETVAMSSLSASGQALDYAGFVNAVKAMNNDTVLEDPLPGTSVCLDEFGDIGATCGYQYFECEDGGYVLRVTFESESNFPLYTQDKLNSDSTQDSDASYDLGNCTGTTINEIGGNVIL